MIRLKILAPLFIFLFLTGCGVSQHPNQIEIQSKAPPEPVDALCGYVYFSWGKMAELNKRFAEAQDAYTKALICDPQSIYLHQRLAFLLIRMDKLELASVHLEKVLENSPKDNQTRLELAGIFDEIGKTEMAVELLEANLADDPKDSNSLFRLGYLYQRHGYLAEARLPLETHIELQPYSYAGHLVLVKVYRGFGEHKLAMEQYEEILELNWSTMQAYDAAELFEEFKEYDKAINLYLRLLKSDAGNELTRRRLAGLYSRTGQTDKALSQLMIIRSSATNVGEIDLVIGRLLLSEKQHEKAIEHLSGMLKNTPDLLGLRSLLGFAYYEHGDIDAAKDVLRGVDVASPAYEGAVLMYARICADSKLYSESVSYIRAAIEKAPQHKQFYYILADLYRLLKQPEAGEEVFEKAIAQFPDDVKLQFEFGLFFETLKQPDRALAQMIKVLEIAPNDAHTLNYVGYTWAERGENLEKALDYVKRAVEQKPDDGYVRDSLGWVYYQMGEYDKAVVELFLATELQPKDPTIKQHLGDAYLKTGDLEKAVEQYERAVDLFKDSKKRALARQKISEVQGDDE